MFLISIRIKTLLSSNPWKIFSFDECEGANVAALQAHINIIPHVLHDLRKDQTNLVIIKKCHKTRIYSRT